MANEMSIPVHKWNSLGGEFGEITYPLRRVRYEFHFISRLWRVEWYDPEGSGECWEWLPV